MRLLSHQVPLMVLGLALAACVTRADIDDIKDTQKKILAKLEAGGRPGMPQQQQRPQGRIRTKVYAFPAGDAAAKGPADAWVTIVEVSDFQ